MADKYRYRKPMMSRHDVQSYAQSIREYDAAAEHRIGIADQK